MRFNGIEIRAVRRQVPGPDHGVPKSLFQRRRLVGSKVIKDREFTGFDYRSQYLFDIIFERFAVDGAVKKHWRNDS